MTETSLVPELAAHDGPTFEEPVAMDVRGRLVQSLKLMTETTCQGRSAAARALPRRRRDSALLQRHAPLGRRACSNLKVPRGAGASAAALLLLASTCYGVVKGGHGPAIAAEIQDICDAAANSVGFRIAEIALAGEHEVSREDILSLAGVTGRSSLLFLDAAQTRHRLLTNPWIAQAAVLKLYPGRLRIEIKERKAFALWQKDGRVYLIAADGTVLETYVPAALCVAAAGGRRRRRACGAGYSRPAQALSGDRQVGRRRRCWSPSGAGTCI